MKKLRSFTSLLLCICFISAFCGCGTENLKDNLLDGYNRLLQAGSKHALTNSSSLQGEKIKGNDTYVGSYTAEYEDFNGKEYIFGGTDLERGSGSSSRLTVAFRLKIISGKVCLTWIHSGSEYTIANADRNDTITITLGAGDNYIVLNGENFSGSLEMQVE